MQRGPAKPTGDTRSVAPEKTPFNWPHMTGKELYYIARCHFNGQLAGDGPFTRHCHQWLEHHCATRKALLTHSCTAALEMAALLLDIEPGDEVIMPSYTFVSTANAFVLRRGVPVFVDIRPDTLNIDETAIERAITPRTRAICVVHYAGVACEMDTILAMAQRHNLKVVEDAAQGLMASYKGRPLGSMGHFGAYSFHETKNIISGEGGALLVNEADSVQRAEIVREKGTDRSRFFRGEVDKYTWQDAGSSFLPGELIAAFLWAQLEEAERITADRLAAWDRYHRLAERLEQAGRLRRPIVPDHCRHNGHMYYVLLAPGIDRHKVLAEMNEAAVNAVFHYVPLHTAPAGQRFARMVGSMDVTTATARSLVRLPLWVGLTQEKQELVIDVLETALR